MNHLGASINGELKVSLKIGQLVIASWTGRDREQLERQIAGLKAIGVETPSSIPCFYRVSRALLTTAEVIDVVGDRSTGEVEAVLLRDDEHGLLVGVGSDHTDRKVEGHDVAISKQVCAKPIGANLWKYDDVADHWDTLRVRSWRVSKEGERVLYQEGTLARLLRPADLIRSVFGSEELPIGTVLFCGTQTVIGELSGASFFELELFDPVRDVSLRHRYAVNALAHA